MENQRNEQGINETRATLREQLARQIDDQQRAEGALAEARRPLVMEFEAASRRHRLLVAGIKVAVLAPLLFVAGVLCLRCRRSGYAAMAYAFGAAVLAKVFVVMHEYFPKEYFRSILIAAALTVVAGLLAKLLAMVRRPGRDAVLRQRCEAYEGFRSPTCEFPSAADR